MKCLNLFFQKTKYNAASLNINVQNTKLENLYLLTRCPKNTKWQKSHRTIKAKGEKWILTYEASLWVDTSKILGFVFVIMEQIVLLIIHHLIQSCNILFSIWASSFPTFFQNLFCSILKRLQSFWKFESLFSFENKVKKINLEKKKQ